MYFHWSALPKGVSLPVLFCPTLPLNMHVPVSFLFKALPQESFSNLPISSFPCAFSQLLQKTKQNYPFQARGEEWKILVPCHPELLGFLFTSDSPIQTPETSFPFA